jgi:hypothetical protein
MEKISQKRYIIFYILCVFFINTSKSYAETKVKGFIKQYGIYGDNDKNFLLNTNIKITSTINDKIGFGGSISPIQLRPNKDLWNIIPEYYLLIKKEKFGKITIGQHLSNADMLIVDGGTFAVGNGYFTGDTDYSAEFSASLIDSFQIQKQKYNFKFGYLSPVISDQIYFGMSYTPSKSLSQARVFYSDTFNSTIDFKASTGVIDTKFTAGFNVQYLGVIVGGSAGDDFYTAGIGYTIGPFKTTLTHVSAKTVKNTTFGAQYNLEKNIIPFIQIGKNITDKDKTSHSIALGIQILM